MAEENEPFMILDFYKDWDSDKSPSMMVIDSSINSPGEIESEDAKKMNYLRSKYKKQSK